LEEGGLGVVGRLFGRLPKFLQNGFKNFKVELIVDHKRLGKVDWEH
jgi:hypothetical protein